jgi:trehalose 6-phosphate synthase/phosphatase
VNRKFAGKVLENAHDDDLVWVHDYQLMLLPALLKVAAPNLRIGFFLHTPFPAYEIFRCHPRRRELVAGMLAFNISTRQRKRRSNPRVISGASS